jgi:hypothetical protein
VLLHEVGLNNAQIGAVIEETSQRSPDDNHAIVWKSEEQECALVALKPQHLARICA